MFMTEEKFKSIELDETAKGIIGSKSILERLLEQINFINSEHSTSHFTEEELRESELIKKYEELILNALHIRNQLAEEKKD